MPQRPPLRPHRWAAVLPLALACGLLTLLGGCQGSGTPWVGDTSFSDRRPEAREKPPAHRRDGPRLPAFSGVAPSARGWVKVDGLLWIAAADQEAYSRGSVTGARGPVPRQRALPPNVAARDGFLLRTDHVALHTNVAWDSAFAVAREAEDHVQRLVGGYGEVLGLRLPNGPLQIVVTATRAEFTSHLRGLVHGHVSWGAFYDARSGIVYTSLEQAPAGGLPWRADLRHEMTHQILDLSRPNARRGRPFPEPWFWLWEGIAVWTEDLGDAPEQSRASARLERFRKRYAWDDWTPLPELFRLSPARFVGKHYDQTASLMRYLMDPAAPARRAATLDTVRRLLRGRLTGTALTRALGMDTGQLQAAWRETVGR